VRIQILYLVIRTYSANVCESSFIYKDLYSHKEVFLDLVKEMLKAPWAKVLKVENLILVDKEYILSDYEENEADIVYKADIDGKEVIFYILLEFQSTVDYRMPLRLFSYLRLLVIKIIRAFFSSP